MAAFKVHKVFTFEGQIEAEDFEEAWEIAQNMLVDDVRFYFDEAVDLLVEDA